MVAMKVTDTIDRVVSWLKWPLAIVSLVLLPGVLYAMTFVVRDIARRPSATVPLLVGAGAFLAVYLVVLRPRTSRHPLVALEHELTHALFAWLTLHRVTGLRATLAGGGHVGYAGRGNWLIAIAPFVVPTFTLLIIAIGHWVDRSRVLVGALGATLTWNVVANWAPPHRHHGDHREAGWIFSLLFVTCANLLVLGLVLAYATGARSITGHLDHVRGPAAAFFGWLVKMIAPG
jgi:hypothetical protein